MIGPLDRLQLWLSGSRTRVLLFMGAVVVAFVALGVWIYTHREDRGFMREACGELRWDRTSLPVPVYLDASMAGDPVWLPELERGVAVWGGLLELRGLLPVGGTASDPVVVVEVQGGLEDHGVARPRWDSTCRIRRVEVTLPGALLPGATRDRAVQHELGHALGLDHDSIETSVMWPTATSLFEWSITEADRERLRAAYGGP